MKTGFLVIGIVLVLSTNAAAQNKKLYGTWRLLSVATTVSGTGETIKPFGENPTGYITYGREGRMQVIIVSSSRPNPSQQSFDAMADQDVRGLLRTVTSYGGTYSFDGKTVVHHVDISWNQVWTGIDLVRDVQISGNRATFTTRPRASPRNGRMETTVAVWEKVK